MSQSVHQYQGSLFTPTTAIVDHPKEFPTTNPLTPPTAHPETPNIEITLEALAAQVIKGLVEHRRWEKELTLGASDEELSKALGNCWSGTPSLNMIAV